MIICKLYNARQTADNFKVKFRLKIVLKTNSTKYDVMAIIYSFSVHQNFREKIVKYFNA